MAKALAIILVGLLILVVCCSSSNRLDIGKIRQVTDNLEVKDVEGHFKHFMQKFGKVYGTTEEYVHRLKVFQANLAHVMSLKKQDPTAIHGITSFADLTPEELSRFLGFRKAYSNRVVNQAPLLPTDNLPEAFDWREHGAVTPVKFQGRCGSCWTFSTTGVVEGANFLKTGKLISLSEEQLIDCDYKDNGCEGGDMLSAYEYVKARGLEAEEDYPYEELGYRHKPVRGPCRYQPSKVVATIANYSRVSEDEDQIAANLVKNGPLSIALRGNVLFTYEGGVACPRICPGEINHGVLLVGYGVENGLRYWTFKNTWTDEFGENGYFRLCRGVGVCDMNSEVGTVST
ncbi:hypothetical protein SELMODRAFT_93661 [Selaginella moellendorffii]|uniref:Cysteine proteinase n=1 Tax=Selaginella moellendorffii TaxID=88036 RepID=D8RGK5_SELML|nr:hypothetical protein SELMODRAFT_93661 [Selaginella moellendorffii]